jgi:hypothetical protein
VERVDRTGGSVRCGQSPENQVGHGTFEAPVDHRAARSSSVAVKMMRRHFGGGFAIRYGKPLLMFASSAQIAGSKPFGNPDLLVVVSQ